MKKLEMIAGLDIGNGYVKGKYRGTDGDIIVDIPSCIAGVSTKPSTFDNVDTDTMNNLFNTMVLSMKSPLVTDDRYFHFGIGAINTGRNLLEFDISDANLSKAQQELSYMLVLASVAGGALQNYVKTNGALPTDILHVDSTIALALPIDEYLSYRDYFANQLKSAKHEVSFVNFEQTVHMTISFETVSVLPEGVSAQYAIAALDAPVLQAMLDESKTPGDTSLDGITASDIKECVNIVGIDIGEGTTNFPVISEGKFNSVASATIQQGFGAVIEQSLKPISLAKIPFNSRKSVANFLQTKETVLNRTRKATVHEIIEQESVDLVNEIVKGISSILSSGNSEIIYVYGGGATPLENVLKPKLIEKAKGFAGGSAFPILYMDSSFARNLNRVGLYNVATSDYEAKLSAKTVTE